MDNVYDAFEGRTYASYFWINPEEKKHWEEVKPSICNIKPPGEDEITCSSSDEFHKLVDKYFGIGL